MDPGGGSFCAGSSSEGHNWMASTNGMSGFFFPLLTGTVDAMTVASCLVCHSTSDPVSRNWACWRSVIAATICRRRATGMEKMRSSVHPYSDSIRSKALAKPPTRGLCLNPALVPLG